MDLLENLKADLTTMIQSEIQTRFKNCDYQIFERRIWLMEQQIHSFTTLFENEISLLRQEREGLAELKGKIKDAQLFLEHELDTLRQEITKQ